MSERTSLVTGGVGFIGANTVGGLAALGDRAIIFDNLSRAAARPNLEWLENGLADLLAFVAEHAPGTVGLLEPA